MIADDIEIRSLETISGSAWPPREKISGPGWEARFSDGMHRRVNSTTVWPETADVAATIRRVESWYAKRGHRPIFKLTRASAPGLDDLLAGRGYEIDAATTVQSRPTTREPTDPDIEIVARPSSEWLDAFAGIVGYDPDRRALLEAQIDRIDPPTGFAMVRIGDQAAAVGLAVAGGDHIGLFELAAHPGHRGRGLARRIVEQLIGWGAGQGAAFAYLQVMEDNPVALALYYRMGFTDRYRYWYRVGPWEAG